VQAPERRSAEGRLERSNTGRTRRALHRRLRDRLRRVVAEKLEHALCAVGLAVGQDRAARLERLAAEVVGSFALRAVDAVEEGRDVDHLRAMLEEIAVDDGALRERGRCASHSCMVDSMRDRAKRSRDPGRRRFGRGARPALLALEAAVRAHCPGRAAPASVFWNPCRWRFPKTSKSGSRA